MTATTTEHLARFAASLSYDDIPLRVREQCKDVLLDTLACALAGHAGEETGQVSRFAASLATSSESTVIGGGNLSLAGATLLNGYLITAVTMCDIHRSTLTHVTPEVVPPALLIGERDNASGRDLMVALAAGFEVTTRVGIGSDYPAVRARGYHGPGVFGPFGGAAAAGRLLGLSAEAMARAFGLVGSQAGGTFAAWGTPTVKFHQCRGALSGLMAALLAEQDFLATREFLTHKDGGLFNTFSNGGKPEEVTKDLGKRWELDQIALRLLQSASSIQGMNTALFDALISAHYTAAIIIQDHVLTLDQSTPERYDDPAIRKAAAELIDIQPDESLKDVQATVDIELADGTKISKRCEFPRGSFENRLTRAQIETKLRTYAKGRISASAADRIIASVSSLENLGSARELMQMLRQDQRAAAA